MAHGSRRGLAVGRTLLAPLMASVLVGCERSGNLLTPVVSPANAPPIVAKATGNTTRGRMLNREEGRRQAIQVARRALEHARAGGTTGLSDGRQLRGAEAVRYWERLLHALETGAPLRPVVEDRPSTTDTASQPTASADGPTGYYVYGNTLVTWDWGYAFLDAYTIGDGADNTTVDGYFTIYLEYTNPNGSWGYSTSREVTTPYYGGGLSDYASASAELQWDSNWYGDFALGQSNHAAHYGNIEAISSSTGSD